MNSTKLRTHNASQGYHHDRQPPAALRNKWGYPCTLVCRLMQERKTIDRIALVHFASPPTGIFRQTAGSLLITNPTAVSPKTCPILVTPATCWFTRRSTFGVARSGIRRMRTHGPFLRGLLQSERGSTRWPGSIQRQPSFSDCETSAHQSSLTAATMLNATLRRLVTAPKRHA